MEKELIFILIGIGNSLMKYNRPYSQSKPELIISDNNITTKYTSKRGSRKNYNKKRKEWRRKGFENKSCTKRTRIYKGYPKIRYGW